MLRRDEAVCWVGQVRQQRMDCSAHLLQQRSRAFGVNICDASTICVVTAGHKQERIAIEPFFYYVAFRSQDTERAFEFYVWVRAQM